MLIRFTVTNYLSLKKDVEFDMLPDNQKWHQNHIYSYNSIDLLKITALYGSNGAGKSNLIKAISLLTKIVTEGDWNPVLDIKPFRLDPSCAKQPTYFEIEFIKNSKPYVYRLSLFNHSVVEESLHESESGKDERKLFIRKTDNGRTKIDLSEDYLRNSQDEIRIQLYQNEFLKEYTPFLKLISESKESFGEIKAAYEWFINNLVIIFPKTRPTGLVERLSRSKEFKKFTDELICSMHTGITKIEINDIALDQFFGKDDQDIADQIRDGLRHSKQAIQLRMPGNKEEVIAILEGGKPVIKRVISKHANKDGKLFDFFIDEESDGTIRLFDLIPTIYSALISEKTVLIDEIDQSIHPALLKELVRKFSIDQNTKGQLIFTTHESNLLDQEIFRRDEIWFVEKNKNGETGLYPLSDYEIRADLDIRKGYLMGKFGAIPFLANLRDLNWDQYVVAE